MSSPKQAAVELLKQAVLRMRDSPDLTAAMQGVVDQIYQLTDVLEDMILDATEPPGGAS